MRAAAALIYQLSPAGCKCAKYLIRAGHIQEGESLVLSFNPSGETDTDTPRHWLWLELARAHQKKGEYIDCLHNCLQLRKSFESIWEDQLDFHVFCLSRMRLCSYVELLRLEDNIYQDPHYRLAAHIAIEVLLKLHDDNNNQEYAVTLKANRKKNKNKSKREKKGNYVVDTDTDTDRQTINHSNYLDEASRFLRPLQEMYNNHLDTYLAGFEICKRKRKVLLMLQNIVRMQLIDPSDERVRADVTYLKQFISTETNISQPVLTVLDTTLDGTNESVKNL